MTTSPRPGADARATATATADHLAAGHGVDDAASDVPHGIRRLPNWVLTLLAIGTLYMLIVAIGVIGDGFKSLGKDAAEGLFDFATNPFIALFVGVLATAIIQSSSTTTTLVVTAVGAGALPIEVAVPMIMGANIGTSVTNTLASFGHAGHKDEFRRAFAASTVHDFFNLFAVIILLPIEIFFHPIQRSAEWLAGALFGTVLPDPGQADLVGALTDPVVDLLGMDGLTGLLPGSDVVAGTLTILLGVAMIFFAVSWLGKILQVLMVGRAKAILEKSVGGHPLTAMGAGMLVTIAVQSSSVTTSVMVPFAGSGALTTRQIYPLTLGANVGTTVTALIAAMAVTGDGAKLALTIALVHTLFNVFGILIIYGLPFLRSLPLLGAETLAHVAAERKIYAVAWVLTVFIIVPALAILIKVLFT
ncbi:Na/Pi cotransporter family protein [Corynebacterium xerosis]|uniref:Na/Pi cotransporter family protein n=1 Tax=Corynebacterium xerosis TaxID=1725 RepID=A0A6B8TUA3_9CORY|nr:Na/Pi symporter [Corynebacterium xerosis]QGS34763.1 Na/Pi cotransporter family protein [Corynebacterium xerosis]